MVLNCSHVQSTADGEGFVWHAGSCQDCSNCHQHKQLLLWLKLFTLHEARLEHAVAENLMGTLISNPLDPSSACCASEHLEAAETGLAESLESALVPCG